MSSQADTRCSTNCPKVREDLRAAVKEAPWLLDEVFPQRKFVDSKLPVTRDVQRQEELERMIEPAAELDIQELKIVQETSIVQEPFIIPEKAIEREHEEVDFVEEKELVVEKTTELEDKEIDFVKERELIAERIVIEEDRIDEDKVDRMALPTKRDEPKHVIKPVAIQEPEVIQEALVAEQPIVIPTDHDDEKIRVTEARKPVVDKTVGERITPVPNEKTEIVRSKIDPTTTPEKFELELKVDVEHREKEEDDDYDEFIDEELQKSLPIVTARQIPEEKEEEEEAKARQEKIPIKDVDRKELAGPSVPERPYQVGVQDEREIPVISPMEVVSREPDRLLVPASVAAEDICDDTCPLINQQKGESLRPLHNSRQQEEARRYYSKQSKKSRRHQSDEKMIESRLEKRIMRKLEERQRVVDHYYLTKGFSYFEDVCTCSLACVLYTLSRDQFVRSIFASLALFAVGLKLCSELDAWEMPSRVS